MLPILKKHWFVSLFLAGFFLFFSYKISSNVTPFYDWDEGIYIETGRELIANPTLSLNWQGNVWLDKPPLVPFFYGTVLWATPFIQPEISARLATLMLSIITLVLVYKLFLKLEYDMYFSATALIMTAFSPIFLQRAQVVNIDVFLLASWAGYFLFYKKRYVGLFFLSIGVLSKSLLGFYPVGVLFLFLSFQLATKTMSKHEFVESIKTLCFHVGVVSVWYVVMFIRFGNAFWVQHIIESHTRRVTASIETHFGKKSYYFEVILKQYSWFVLSAVLGWVIVFRNWILNRKKSKSIEKKRDSDSAFFYANALLPWFVFLNLTKTKIHWYVFPSLPQFPLLMVYPLMLLKKRTAIYRISLGIIIVLTLYNAIIRQGFHAFVYSRWEPHQRLAQQANEECQSLDVLVDSDSRQTMRTLNELDLAITTTDWWGTHPSIMTYFDNPVRVYYNQAKFIDLLDEKLECVMIPKDDISIVERYSYRVIAQDGNLILLKNQKD